MPRKKHSAEEIIGKLREAEVLLAQGKEVPEVSCIFGVTEQTYFRWRKEYGGLKKDQARRLKQLERENARLKKAVADLTLDKLILKRSNFGKLLSAARRRICVHHIQETLGVSERRACRVLGQARSTPNPLLCDMLPKCPMTKRRLPKQLSALPASLDVMAFAGLQRCCALKVGM